MNSILGIFAYAPTNFRIACLFFIHESWLFCVCYITLIIIHLSLTPYSQWSSSCFIRVMVMQLSKYTLHNLAIPWENINNDTLNTYG